MVFGSSNRGQLRRRGSGPIRQREQELRRGSGKPGLAGISAFEPGRSLNIPSFIKRFNKQNTIRLAAEARSSRNRLGSPHLLTAKLFTSIQTRSLLQWQNQFMSIKINPRQKDGAIILDINGRLTLGEGTVILREQVRALISTGHKKILLNLQAVPYIDSSGLGELVSAFTAARREGGDLKLLNLGQKVHGLLQITKLYTVFEVFDDEQAALRSFLGEGKLKAS